MRFLVRLALICAAVLSLASVAVAGDRAEKPAKPIRPDRPHKGDKPEKPAKRQEDRADATGRKPKPEDPPAHPHGAPPGQVKAPGEPAHPEFTEFARTVGAAPTVGRVRIKRPGDDAYTELTAGESMPVGTVVDAREGLVEIMSEAAPDGTEQNAVVTGSIFRIEQDVESGVTDLKLQGGDFSNCKNAREDDGVTARAASRRKGGTGGKAAKRTSGRTKRGGNVARGLWAAGKGRFRTHGRNSAATVRGTRWATVDRCHSTTVKVFDGVVDVKDFTTGRTVVLGAGGRHVARERPGRR